MNRGELSIYRRKLPHWRMDGAIYFVTWRLRKNQPLLRPVERTAVVSAIRYFESQRYDLFAYVVMDDHAHVLVSPVGECSLHQILHSWKSFSARQLQRHYGRSRSVWQDESFDRIVRDEEEFNAKLGYILGNPFARWPDIVDYSWCGCGTAMAGTEACPTEGSQPT